MRTAATAAIGLLLGGAFYLLLIDTTSPPELYVLVGVSALAGIAFASSRELGFTEASIKGRWLRNAWRPFARVPVDIAVLLREAAMQLIHRRPRRGLFRAVRFAGGENPDAVGRRALAELLGSLAPNTIVIGVDTERELLLVHQLRHDGGREELDVLGLG